MPYRGHAGVPVQARARSWRERHHPESLDKRHAKGVADRRVEFWPDSDGMAWVAAFLPADQASAIWNRLTATARGKQGPNEPRSLPQLRAGTFTDGLLNRQHWQQRRQLWR